jgi:hypothetical protein
MVSQPHVQSEYSTVCVPANILSTPPAKLLPACVAAALVHLQVECMAQSVDRAVIACACGRDLLLWDYAKLVELADEVRPDNQLYVVAH